MSYLWILTSATESDPVGSTLICPDQAPKLTKVQKLIHVLHLPPACSATSQHFHLPPRYKNYQMTINISLNTANLNTMNTSSSDFQVWWHLEDYWNKTQLHKLADVYTVPVAHLYKHMIDNNGPILLFNLADTFFSHRDLHYSYRNTDTHRTRDILLLLFWSQPVILVHWPFWSGSLWHTIEDDDVEVAPIYRNDSKAGQPVIRPCKNHDLHMKQEPTRIESQ